MVLAASTVAPFELPARIAELSLSRAAGVAHTAPTYESLMLACIENGRPTYAYRLLEEGAADGLRLREFSDETRAVLDGLIPPEAEEQHAPATASAKARPPRGPLLVDPPPSLWVQPSSSVRSFDCAQRGGDSLASAWAAVAQRSEPVLFRGVGAAWPALQSWTLPTLCNSLRRGMVRVSPDARFTFCRESHPDVQSGALTPPSRTLIMDVDEFVDRLHDGRAGRSPLLYGTGERCYLQALAPHDMMRDVDFSFLEYAARPPSALDEEQDAEEEEGGPAVLGRLWVSAPGTVSPLHYDLTDSYLCQVRGVKRLLLWPSSALKALSPYPPDHALARRLNVDVTGSEPPKSLRGPLPWRAHARNVVEAPLEAVLYPGDVLYFPANWAHHTEALVEGEEPGAPPQPSFSLGFRTNGEYLL